MIHLDAAALARALPIGDAVDALEAGVGVTRDDPLRSRLATDAGELLVMPSAGPEGAGVKVVGIAPGNAERGLAAIQGLYVLLDPETLQPAATIDGAALTVLRTAALSGLATRHLARADAARLVVFGTGPQAAGHVAAMAAVRQLTDVVVVGRDAGRAQRVADVARSLDLHAAVVVDDPDAVTAALIDADLVCTCTGATEPLFDGTDLADGTHVNAIGSHRPQDRELDEATIVRARVVVEAREPAWAEAGELALPLAAGAIDATHVVADLAELVAGAAGRTGDADVTVFKAVGAAFEDLIVAAAAVQSSGGR